MSEAQSSNIQHEHAIWKTLTWKVKYCLTKKPQFNSEDGFFFYFFFNHSSSFVIQPSVQLIKIKRTRLLGYVQADADN